MLILKVSDMLTLERIESLPRDSILTVRPYVCLLTTLGSFTIGEGGLVCDSTITLSLGDLCLEHWSESGLLEKRVVDISGYFADWLNPTPEELTLWTLETGFEPVETYVEQMEKMMKEFKYV